MAGASKRRRTWASTSRKRARMTLTRPVGLRSEHRKVFTFLRTVHLCPSGTPTLGQCWQQYRPSLSELPAQQLAEVTGLFDMYKLNKFSVIFMPRFVDFDAGSALTNPVPNIYVNPDENNLRVKGGQYDLGTFNFFLERANRGVWSYVGDRKIKVTQNRPMVYDAGTGELTRSSWTSTEKTDVINYGIDVFFKYVNFALGLTTSEYDVIYEYDLSFRGKR